MRFVSHTHTHGDSLKTSPPVSSTHISRIIFSVGVASLIGSLAAPTAASSGHASGVMLEAAVAEGPDTPPPPFAGTRLGCPVPGEFRSSRYQWNRPRTVLVVAAGQATAAIGTGPSQPAVGDPGLDDRRGADRLEALHD